MSTRAEWQAWAQEQDRLRAQRALAIDRMGMEKKARLIKDELRAQRANDHLTLSAAHRLLSVLRDETNSRSVHDECADVMAKLERMVEG